MFCRHCSQLLTALAAIALALSTLVGGVAKAQERMADDLVSAAAADHAQNDKWDADVIAYQSPDVLPAPMGETWIAAPGNPVGYPSGYQQPMAMPPAATPMMPSAPTYTDPTYIDPTWGGQAVMLPSPTDGWFWQALPDGLIYHSYWAGVREPRLGIVMQDTKGIGSYFDGTVGGRVGLLRYGTGNAIFPQGYQLDVEAAAIMRLTLDEMRDFDSADYRVGIPLTYGIDAWQFKLAVYHLSSHLGDEYAIRNPGSLADRINYVRDEIVFGTSYYPVPVCRLYGEVGWAFNVDGGAEPWEVQFGTELSAPGPTGLRGTPFFAINGHLREEVDWGGDLSTQVGWLWRGNSGQVTRIGLHYFNGKSSQYQTFTQFEEQIGLGLWYDF